MDLVAFHRAAETGDVGDSRQAAELALQRPILQRLEVVERVDVAPLPVLIPEGIAVNLADGTFRRNLRLHAGRQRLGELQAIDHLLPRCPVIDTVMKLDEQARQPEERLAAEALQPGHPRQRHLQGDRHQALHLLARSARVLCDDLDRRRGGVRVGFHVDMEKGVAAADGQRDNEQQHDERLVNRPGDDLTNQDANLRDALLRIGRRITSGLAVGRIANPSRNHGRISNPSYGADRATASASWRPPADRPEPLSTGLPSRPRPARRDAPAASPVRTAPA